MFDQGHHKTGTRKVGCINVQKTHTGVIKQMDSEQLNYLWLYIQPWKDSTYVATLWKGYDTKKWITCYAGDT